MSKRPRANWRNRDPFLKREREKYGQEAPSREFLLDFLHNRGKPLGHERICEELKLEEPWLQVAVDRRLRAMARDGQLMQNRRGAYGVVSKMDLIAGRVIGHPEGYGFLKPDDGSEDLYLSGREMRTLLHGDRAVVRVAGTDRRGRREAAPVEILERNNEKVVGRFFLDSGIGYVVADNRRISQDIDIPPEHQGGARHGQIVEALITQQPTARRRPLGRVLAVLGDHMAPGMEVEIAIRAHNLPHEWPAEVVSQTQAIPDQVSPADLEGRLDLRDLPLVTIDGVTARDFDDAVYCERRGRNWRLLVAIADVSHYVAPGTALDREAHLRGNSVYFPDRVIPMLPEKLSNGLCSLNPEVDRLCLVCEMTINAEGHIVRSRFAEAVMHSHARLTYELVAGILVARDEAARREFGHLVPHLENLYSLYKVLRGAREGRGAMDFETQETVIEYRADRKIERIVPSERNDAHKLIEECMIAANVAAARYLERNRLATLYRIHEGPPLSRVEELRSFLSEFGLGLGGGEKPQPRDYGELIARIQGRPDFNLIQTVLLRSLAQAVYAPANKGHFGLALQAYAHFTSPIRRYPDLLVHRGIRHLLRGGKARDFQYGSADMESLGEHCSATERNADDAVRSAVEWLKCEYMQDKVGMEFDGIVSAVVSFGLFVELREVYVEGLVHITSLPNDYYHFDAVGHRLVGERGGRIFRLGDPLRVKVVRVDLDDRKIDFEAVVRSGGKRRRGRGRK